MSMPDSKGLAELKILNVLALTSTDAVLALSDRVDDWMAVAYADVERAEANLERQRHDPDLFAKVEDAQEWLEQAQAARVLVDQLVHRRTARFRG